VGNKVGPKGQVVIEKAIRDALGVEPGAIAVQQVVDDHVEIRFLPPRHNRSLFGAARPFIKRWPKIEDVDSDVAWAEAAAEKDRTLVEELRRRGRSSGDERPNPVPDGRSAGPG
jgi:AbrB family looped-hinge helix DNA binding protein